MTPQDRWFASEEEAREEAQEEAAPPRPRRWILAGAGALTVVLALAALVVVAVGRRSVPPRPGAAPAASSSSPAGSPDEAPQQGPVVIEAALGDPALAGDSGQPGPLIVGTQSVQGGAGPDRVPNFDTCHADAATLRHLPVQVRMPANWLRATSTVQTTAGTPADIGRLGFFFQAGEASTPCPVGAWSTSDSFLASDTGQQLITGYVVLDQAFTPTTPRGRADVFRTLRLRVSKIRCSDRRAIVEPPTVGSLCPGTQDELCAPLG